MSDALDFIGWYNYKSHKQLGIGLNNPENLYLAYHEGYKGYSDRTYRKKPWLMDVASRVQKRSEMYQKQYWGCAEDLKKKRFFIF